MAPTMLAVTLATAVLLAGVSVLFARVFTRRPVPVHEDPDLDPLLALPEAERDSERRLANPRCVVAGAVLPGLALTTFGTAGGRRPGPN